MSSQRKSTCSKSNVRRRGSARRGVSLFPSKFEEDAYIAIRTRRRRRRRRVDGVIARCVGPKVGALITCSVCFVDDHAVCGHCYSGAQLLLQTGWSRFVFSSRVSSRQQQRTISKLLTELLTQTQRILKSGGLVCLSLGRNKSRILHSEELHS